MLSNFRKTFILVTAIATLSTGCKYTEEYQKLTDASYKYTVAVDELLVKAGELQIETTSENILANDSQVNQTVAQYRKFSKQDKEILEIITKIREHNRLLQKYFSKLGELASSDAPENTQAEIEGIANNLQTISSNLRTSSLSPNTGLLKGIGHLAIHSKINGALREELQKRDRTIIQELEIQREMLKKLSDFMQSKVERKQNALEMRSVIDPLTQEEEIADKESWIQKRKEILATNMHVQELKNAGDALTEFKNVFKDSVEGKINSVRLSNALNDIDSFLALLENKQELNSQANSQ